MNIQSALCALDVQIFCPLMTKSSPSRTARVWSEARSDPAADSLNPWHQRASPDSIRERCSFFCSSLPCTISVGPTIITPMPPTGGTRCSANSSFMMNCSITPRPAPPYSFGQAGAIPPRQVRRHQATADLVGVAEIVKLEQLLCHREAAVVPLALLRVDPDAYHG